MTENLAEYLEQFGQYHIAALGETAVPIVRGFERAKVPLLREPLAAQWARIDAIVASWREGVEAFDLSGETGTGKTLIASVATYLHAAMAQRTSWPAFRALVYCPSHLVNKWQRELQITIPGVKAVIITGYRDVLALRKLGAANRPEYYILSDSKAKLATSKQPAYMVKRSIDGEGKLTETLHCPNCGSVIEVPSETDKDAWIPAERSDLEKKQLTCAGNYNNGRRERRYRGGSLEVEHEGRECGAPLWAWTRKPDRWACATLIGKKLRNWFTYLVLDEAHTANSKTSASGNATAILKRVVKYKVDMTGTIMNGYASSLFARRFRGNPKPMVDAGFGWDGQTKFVKQYGRIETVTTYKYDRGKNNSTSRGKQLNRTERQKPGIVPSIYGDVLMGNTAFLSLDELGVKLPEQTDHLHAVPMGAEMAKAYEKIEDRLREVVQPMLARGSKAAMAVMIGTLLAWPDYPSNYGPIGYKANGVYTKVMDPPELSAAESQVKELALTKQVSSAIKRGNQCWVYNVMTGKRDVHSRLERVLSAAGHDVRVLWATKVPPSEREEWIRKQGKADVIIVHPQCVATGLDAFLPSADGAGYDYNFNSLFFYNSGYVLDTVRQASGRARRIGQRKDCELHYLYYLNTMQENCARLMSAKVRAAQAVDGSFIDRGLAMLASEDDDIQMSLVKSLLAMAA